MSKITSSDVRSWETKALADDGVITTKEAGDLKKLIGTDKLGANEKALLKDIVQHDRFESKAKTAVLKLAGATKLESSPVLGKEVAKGVFVQQSFSPVKGHRTQEQALAAARMSGAQNTLAVKDSAGRWHAVAATKSVSEKDAMKGVATLHDCPPAAFKDLYDRAAAATGDEKKQLFTKLAAITYGVPESQINVMTKDTDKPVKGQININAAGTMQGAGQITSGCSCGKAHENFKPGSNDYAIQVKSDQLADPKKAAGVMFHELSHADDYLAAQKVFAAYQKAEPAKAAALQKADFSDRNALGGDAIAAEEHLQKWIHGSKDKAVSSLSLPEKWKLQGYLTGNGGATESTAYTRSFAQEFRAIVKEMDGVKEPADKKSQANLEYWDKLGGQLITYASGQAGRRIPKAEGQKSQVETELRAFYATLTPKEQDRFKEVMTHIQARYPKSQVAELSIP